MSTLILTVFLSLSLFASGNKFTFEGREIDLDPYLMGMEYGGYLIDSNSNTVTVRVRNTDQKLLYYKYPKESKWDFKDLKPLLNFDVSNRNIWGSVYSKRTKKFYIYSDENNDEVFNIYSVNPTNGHTKKLTNFSYIYGINISPDGKYLAYSARINGPEGTDGEIGIIDLDTDKTETLYKDTKENRLYFGPVVWTPDSKKIIFKDTVENVRGRQNLNSVDLANPNKISRITDRAIAREGLPAYGAWESNDVFYFVAIEDNDYKIKKYSFSNNSIEVVPYNFRAVDVAIQGQGNDIHFIVKYGRPYMTQIVILDIKGRTVSKWDFSGTIHFLNRTGQQIHVIGNGFDTPPSILSFTEKHLKKPLVSFKYPQSITSKIVHCNYEKIDYLAHDGLKPAGESNQHAYLLSPKNPLPKNRQILLVEAFYGGNAVYSIDHQIFCQAGIHVLTPAPRGSYNWPYEFSQAIEGDLGGSEILDVIQAAKLVSTKLNIPPERVGAFGFSHGGYATMRLLTFPGEVNGYKESFKWGFGIAGAGMSDLIRFTKTTNIPGWPKRLCGEDPSVNPDKWQNRSPEAHAKILHGPLLMLHGSNDMRVPVEESRAMSRKLEQLNLPHKYIEFEGEGHGMKSYKNRSIFLSSQLHFIENFVLKAK